MALETDKQYVRAALTTAPIRISLKNHYLDLITQADQDDLDNLVEEIATNAPETFQPATVAIAGPIPATIQNTIDSIAITTGGGGGGGLISSGTGLTDDGTTVSLNGATQTSLAQVLANTAALSTKFDTAGAGLTASGTGVSLDGPTITALALANSALQIEMDPSVGTLDSLTTTDKSNVVAAVNEVKGLADLNTEAMSGVVSCLESTDVDSGVLSEVVCCIKILTGVTDIAACEGLS